MDKAIVLTVWVVFNYMLGWALGFYAGRRSRD